MPNHTDVQHRKLVMSSPLCPITQMCNIPNWLCPHHYAQSHRCATSQAGYVLTTMPNHTDVQHPKLVMSSPLCPITQMCNIPNWLCPHHYAQSHRCATSQAGYVLTTMPNHTDVQHPKLVMSSPLCPITQMCNIPSWLCPHHYAQSHRCATSQTGYVLTTMPNHTDVQHPKLVMSSPLCPITQMCNIPNWLCPHHYAQSHRCATSQTGYVLTTMPNHTDVQHPK